MSKKKTTESDQLIEALAFIEPGVGDVEFEHKFVRLANKQAVSSNGQISCGHPVSEELILCPQHKDLLTAIKKCGSSLVISETPGGKISVKGKKLRALVNTLNADDLLSAIPDERIGKINNSLKTAFKICGKLATEAAARVIEASLLLEKNTCTGTNGFCIIQFWHGIDLPNGIVIPKVFSDAVARAEYDLTDVGFSFTNEGVPNTITVWFENGSWIKTLCYSDKWPKLDKALEGEPNPKKLPVDFFEGVEAVSKFNDKGTVFLDGKQIKSQLSDKEGAQFTIKDVPKGIQFNGELLYKVASSWVSTIDLDCKVDNKPRVFFFGSVDECQIRGVLMGIA
jgi:hypothetical protein